MILKSFKCNNLHGYIVRSIDLFSDISILHGINGSGKTSILKAIVSLITPDVLWLCSTEYDLISVTFSNDGSDIQVQAERTKSEVVLSVHFLGMPKKHSLTVKFPVVFEAVGLDYPPSRTDRLRFLRERIVAKASGAPALQFIDSLPTPIFLGLERTTLSSTEPPTENFGTSKNPRLYFRTMLDDSISEAQRLLQIHIRRSLADRNKAGEALISRIILTIFSTEHSEISDLTLPNRSTMRMIDRMRDDIIKTFTKIPFNQSIDTSKVSQFFDTVGERARPLSKAANKRIPKGESPFGHIIQSIGIDPLTRWFNIMPNLQFAAAIMTEIDEYNIEESRIQSRIENYLAILNSFLEDSGKYVSVNDEGQFEIGRPGGRVSDAFCLSSGERQIFVLLTQLAFRSELKSSVLIIDEPELSLHLKWQGQFISSLRSVNSNVQMLLATHSPMIIGDKIQNCIEL